MGDVATTQGGTDAWYNKCQYGPCHVENCGFKTLQEGVFNKHIKDKHGMDADQYGKTITAEQHYTCFVCDKKILWTEYDIGNHLTNAHKMDWNKLALVS